MLKRLHAEQQSVALEGVTNAEKTHREEPRPDDYDDGLLATAGPIMFAAYGAIVAAAFITFSASSEAVFAVVICAVYFVMYLGIPLVMFRMRTRHDPRWRRDARKRRSEDVVTFTGTIRRGEAIAQMVTVPLCVAAAFVALCIVSTIVG